MFFMGKGMLQYEINNKWLLNIQKMLLDEKNIEMPLPFSS